MSFPALVVRVAALAGSSPTSCAPWNTPTLVLLGCFPFRGSWLLVLATSWHRLAKDGDIYGHR